VESYIQVTLVLYKKTVDINGYFYRSVNKIWLLAIDYIGKKLRLCENSGQSVTPDMWVRTPH